MPDLIKLLHSPLSPEVMYLVIERVSDHDAILSYGRDTSIIMLNLEHFVLFLPFVVCLFKLSRRGYWEFICRRT